jgi:hypothetical protein
MRSQSNYKIGLTLDIQDPSVLYVETKIKARLRRNLDK